MAGSNSPFSSSGSISSILRSASSMQQKIQDYNDAIVSYEWENSSKSYADFTAYAGYLGNRIASSSDPMGQLTLQKKVDAAHGAYISNEIQRQSIDVIEGNSTNTDKYNRMADLYYEAANAGQFDLAQGLHLQLDNLSVTIQNDQKAAIASNKEYASQYAGQIDNQVKDAEQSIKDNAKVLLDEYSTLGPDKFQQTYGSDIFSALNNMVNSPDPNSPGLLQIYEQASGMTPDPAKVRAYQQAFNGIAQGGTTGIKLPGVGDVSLKELSDQAYASSIGQSLFESVDTGNGVQFKKNSVTGYQYGRDETGNYKLMPVYGTDAKLSTTAPDANGKLQTTDLAKQLKNAGFEMTGTNTLRNNGEFDSAGIARGQQVQVYVGADGRLQIVNGDKAFSLNFDPKTQKYAGLEAQTPDLINLLPSGNQASSRFNNRYFAQQMQNDPNFLSNLPSGAVGLVDTQHTTLQPGMLLNSAADTRSQIQLQNAAKIPQVQPATPLQAPAAPQIQQTASPLGLPSSTKLTIAAPKPLPKITVAPKQQGTVTVNNPKLQSGLSVGVAQPNTRISF